MILEYLQPKRFEFANLSSSEINEGVTNLEIIEDPRLPKLSEYKVRDSTTRLLLPSRQISRIYFFFFKG